MFFYKKSLLWSPKLYKMGMVLFIKLEGQYSRFQFELREQIIGKLEVNRANN